MMFPGHRILAYSAWPYSCVRFAGPGFSSISPASSKTSVSRVFCLFGEAAGSQWYLQVFKVLLQMAVRTVSFNLI